MFSYEYQCSGPKTTICTGPGCVSSRYRQFLLYLFLLLYADDTVVLAECPEDLQRALDMLNIFCEFRGLDINVRKTKVMIFSRGKISKIPKFCFNEETVDVFRIINIWEQTLAIITSLKRHNSYSLTCKHDYVLIVKEMSAT